ncbi:MAG: hypothetical protein PHX78_11480 [bacterium]|nr:hypothetical protein [bacterium]
MNKKTKLLLSVIVMLILGISHHPAIYKKTNAAENMDSETSSVISDKLKEKEVINKNSPSGKNDMDSKQYKTLTNDGFVRDWTTSEAYTSQSMHESFKAEVLKIFSAKEGDALFRVYVVKWKGQEVIADDPLVSSDYKVGDTATILMMDLPHPSGKANKRLLNFTIMPTQSEPIDREKALKELNELEKILENNK